MSKLMSEDDDETVIFASATIISRSCELLAQ